jgi:deoxyribodipyrimidine photolyase-related protein
MPSSKNNKANKTIGLIFPHQLFEKNSFINEVDEIYIIEEYLFFNQYKFHKTKIAFHRASIKYYYSYLNTNNNHVYYIEAQDPRSEITTFINGLTNVCKIIYYDVVDDWLDRRIHKSSKSKNIELDIRTTPLFINSKDELNEFFNGRKRMFQTDFYIHQRKIRNILLEKDGSPLGGKWTYDAENRVKYPKGKTPPKIKFLEKNNFDIEADDYVNKHYQNNYGELQLKYPTTHAEAKDWLLNFLTERFHEFGLYEDAMVSEENFLNHSILSPIINNGLLHPGYVIDQAIKFADKYEVPLNSLEGFVRQILGWREFIRAVYIYKGREERTKNFWNFTKAIPDFMYTGNSGIVPLDNVIHKVLKTSYNHHIERLMVLGNIFLLMEIHPDDVYKWFMEMYIDAYDWVMVPNVYGMSQFADGGLMATKPYICSSNYIMKMSNYSKGNWQIKVDTLFWDFLDKHRTYFLKNPRMAMLIRTRDKKQMA